MRAVLANSKAVRACRTVARLTSSTMSPPTHYQTMHEKPCMARSRVPSRAVRPRSSILSCCRQETSPDGWRPRGHG
jgi:hypothetical protein